MPKARFVFVGGVSLVGAGCYYSYLTGRPWFFKHLAMPATRAMDPERAHRFSISLASKGLLPRDKARDPDVLVSLKCTLLCN